MGYIEIKNDCDTARIANGIVYILRLPRSRFRGYGQAPTTTCTYIFDDTSVHIHVHVHVCITVKTNAPANVEVNSPHSTQWRH